ncbi:isochorismatase family protein [Micromonospora sp. C97]|uniref:isochorismatase family protein n=1 Tax=Micromonospora sp. C97 TaxID=2824883 RepID=UPI001B39756B|nr:isochorismatase family protein [Micromonospora sp. C97]MBQ1030369.1 isochorismatase family protein [Micromonospora sp. C97]
MMNPVPDSSDDGFGGVLSPGARPAVLVIDLMRAYFDPDSPLCLPSADCLQSAGRIIAAARDHRIPVLHTRVAYGPGGVDGGLFVLKVTALQQLFSGGGAMGELMPQVSPTEDELVLVKQYASAFFGTSLASTLRAERIDTVVLVGVSTSGCVRATAVDAIQHGLVPLVVRDAVADRAPGPHEASLFDLQAKYAEVVSEARAVAYLSEER